MKVTDAGQGITSVLAVLEPWLHADFTRQPYRWDEGYGPYGIEAIVKAAPGTVATTAREVRAHLLNQAEDALDALGPAGWQFTTCPAMEFGGSVKFATVTMDGKLWEPAEQYGISLKLRFEVVGVRPR